MVCFRPSRVLRLLPVAAAAALLGAGPAGAAIVSSGLVSPDPTSGSVPGFLGIGQTGAGSVTVNGGSVLTTSRFGLANLAGQTNTGDGSLVVTGAGSRLVATATDNGNIDIGGLGKGSLSLLNGGTFSYGTNTTGCILGCQLKVSESAGSNGSFLISGAGSAFDTPGAVYVGQSLLWRSANGDSLDYGAIGGAAKGTMTLEAGGTAASSFLFIGHPGSGAVPRSTESATGNVVLDGIGTAWNIVRHAVQTGGRSLVSMGGGLDSTGTLEIRNGAQMKLDGSSAPGEYAGLNLSSLAAGATTSNASSAVSVKGADSRLEFNGGIGFINAGRGFGTQATLSLANGGFLGTGAASSSETGLVYLSVGTGGGTGTATVDGNGTLLRLSGRNSATNSDPAATLSGGAFLNVGRSISGAAGHGTMSITNGGRVEIDTSALVLSNVNGQTGFYVGGLQDSTGSLTVSGANSMLHVNSGSGVTPYAAVGRDGATGTLLIAGGGRIQIDSAHTSVPNPGGVGYLAGDLNNFEIGRRSGGNGSSTTSTGTATITGAGSALVLGGTADAFIQVGRGFNAYGTLNLLAGGETRSKAVFIGTESGNGTLVMNAGKMLIQGVLDGGASAGLGGGLGVGRSGGTGIANVSNGSVIELNSTAPSVAVSIGGSPSAIGGTGIMNLSGGSRLTVNSPNSVIGVARSGSAGQAGVGTLTLTGAGTRAEALGDGARVLIGATSHTVGTVVVGSGATLSSSGVIGVAHTGTASSGGIGTLAVNGTASAAQLLIGSGGMLSGSGVVNAAVVNQGVVNGGNSPGRLTINGAFDNREGKIVLEVQSLGNGQFAVDELVFTDWSQVVMGDGEIEFAFLGDTNPEDFLDAGLFTLGTFFKQVDSGGQVSALAGADKVLFSGAAFGASAEQYTITAFSFDADGGGSVTAVAAVPLPAPLLLLLAGLGLLARQRRARARTPVLAGTPAHA